MNRRLNFTFILLIFGTYFSIHAQIEQPKAPKTETFTPITPNNSYQKTAPQQNQQNDKNQLRNRVNVPQNPNEIYRQLQRNNQKILQAAALPPKQMASVRFIQEIVKENQTFDSQKKSTASTLPPLQTYGRKKYFDQAYSEIVSMIDGTKPLNLKRAIFLTEQAYNVGTLNYGQFSTQIKNSVSIIKQKLMNENIEFTEANINRMVHQFMCDTLIDNSTGKILSYPTQYDFNDPFGMKDANALFVSKLVKTKKGQCKSFPLLFLILTQELGGNAYLSFSPSHTFVKCKNENGRLYNIELTNGHVTSDSWLLASGHVKSQAVRSGIYLDTMNTRQVVAHCLVDLSMYYRYNFAQNNFQSGYDSFSLKCLNKALEVTPNDIIALLEKSNYYTALVNVMASRKKYTEQHQIDSDMSIRPALIQRDKLYALTDGLGYETMSEEAYSKWLQSYNEK